MRDSSMLPAPAIAPWLCALGLLTSVGACSTGAQETRPPATGAATSAAEGATSSATGTEDTDRMEEVRRVCSRKAASAMSRCWNQEFERTHNRKMEASIEVLIMVTPGGTAESVKVIGNAGGSKELAGCVAEEAQSWTYPEGKNATPVNCRFLLRSTM